MDENARLHIAVGIDMAVIPAAGNTAAHKLPVILEVKGKQLLSALHGTDLTDPVEHICTLFHRRHQLRRRIVADGHIMEIPGITAALFNNHIQEFVACHRLHIISGIADGGAENQAVRFQTVHGFHNPVKAAVPSSAVVGVFKALQADGKG